MSELLQSGQHPDADQLSAFLEHALPAHEQEETLAHLAICPHCRSIVALSMPTADPLPPGTRPAALAVRLDDGVAGGRRSCRADPGRNLHSEWLGRHKHETTNADGAVHSAGTPKEEPPAPTVELQRHGNAPPRKRRSPSAAPAPEAAAESQAADRLMPVPGGGGHGHLNQNQSAALGAAKVEGGIVPAQAVAGKHGLPSGLRALSTVANAGEAIAIDTQHTLFFSNDAGTHWTVVTQPWQGRAVKVELVRASYPTVKRNAALAGTIGRHPRRRGSSRCGGGTAGRRQWRRHRPCRRIHSECIRGSHQFVDPGSPQNDDRS